jgi:hypothetical protein
VEWSEASSVLTPTPTRLTVRPSWATVEPGRIPSRFDKKFFRFQRAARGPFFYPSGPGNAPRRSTKNHGRTVCHPKILDAFYPSGCHLSKRFTLLGRPGNPPPRHARHRITHAGRSWTISKHQIFSADGKPA